MGRAGLRHSSHVPLPLPIEDNIGVIVEDGLALTDLAQEAALGRVIDQNPKDGGITRLVLVEEPRVLGEGALLPLVLLNVRLVTLRGPVVA